MNVPRRTILIIHPGSLGDVLLAIPAMREIRTAYPECAVGLMSMRAVGTLLRACGEVDESFSLEGGALAGLLSGPGAVEAHLREWLGRCVLLCGWFGDDEGKLMQASHELGVTKAIVQSPFRVNGQAVHQSDRFLLTLGGLASGGTRDSCEYPIQLPDDLKACARDRLDGLLSHGERAVMVHPGSGSRHKCVSPRTLATVFDHLLAQGYQPVVVEGPADGEQTEELAQACSQAVPFVTGVNLPIMAGMLSEVGLFLGHDSGLTHLSAWLGVRTVAIFGPTDELRWAHRGPHVRIVRAAPCRCREWQDVLACQEKPCLAILADHVAKLCVEHYEDTREASK
jgi:ADP-heptose:LPS heptosyltransferase